MAVFESFCAHLSTEEAAVFAIIGEELRFRAQGSKDGIPPAGDIAQRAVGEDAGPASSFGLDVNYPNPFNPVTVIPFRLPEASVVHIEVVDVMGRRVAVLVDGHHDEGLHEVRFDASGLASGLYVVRALMRPNGGDAHRFARTIAFSK